MVRRLLCLSIASACLAGCVHSGLMPNHEQRDFATGAYEYALLANNAYAEEEEWIDLPDGTTLEVECPNDEIGLAYSIFKTERKRPERDEYVFAFRGTEGFGHEGRKDWWYGNVSYAQQERSIPIVERFVKEHSNDDIVFVGHSLGGGLAFHNSLRHLGRRVYVFNTSPVYFPPKGYDPRTDRTERWSISESGEILNAVRLIFFEAKRKSETFNCYNKGRPIYEHSILRIGICLTRVAASESAQTHSEAARARIYLDRNPWAIEATTPLLRPPKPTAPCAR